MKNRDWKAGRKPCHSRFYRSTRPCWRPPWTRMVRKSVEETLNAMLDASGRRDHRRRALRAQRGAQLRAQRGAQRGAQGVPCRPLRAGPDRQGREDEPQGAETQGRGVLLGGDRTLPTQGRERRRGADRHVPGRREHASGRRCQPAIVGRPHALADPERVFSQVGVSCFVTNFFRFSA